jgi:purine-binding chemotaxis protein CheW
MEELAVRNNVANKSEIKQYIVIRINNEFFGIDIMNVDSIVKIQQITRVPKSQDYFIGVINLRGEIVPVMSLRKRFGVKEVPDDSATRIIILKLDQNLVGIKVDMVRDVVALEETDIEKNNIVTENNGQMFIKAVGKHDDELISILGLHSVVIDREQA